MEPTARIAASDVPPPVELANVRRCVVVSDMW